jgi:hypothetical protein
MRRTLWYAVLPAAVAIAIFPATVQCQQQDQSKPAQQSSGSQSAGTGAAQTTTQTPPAQQESLAEAARRAREQKKDTPTQAKVFTNDNIPKEGGISAVGTDPTPPPDNSNDAAAATDTSQLGATQGTGEKQWRDRFARLRHKLEQDQSDLDIMERELGVLDVQNYSDPVKAMQQGLTRSDINEKTAKIEAKKKQIESDKQAISDAEDDLRKAGGDPGWAR